MKVTSIINGVKFNLSEGLEVDVDSNGYVNIFKRNDVKQKLKERMCGNTINLNRKQVWRNYFF